MDELNNLKKKAVTAFKLSGFIVRSEICTFLAEQLLPLIPEEQEKWLNSIMASIQNQRLASPHIDKKHIENAINEINRIGFNENETVFTLINAFEVPRFILNKSSKKFELDLQKRNLFPTADKKAKCFNDRYEVLRQRTIRHELFSPAVEGTSSHLKKFKLYNVENLLCTSTIEEAVVLGMLVQLTEGKFYIEDPTGVVPLNLTDARFHSGFFCEGCFVLAEGKYQDGVLEVAGLGFPPAELAKSSRAYFGIQNTWGGPSTTLLKYSEHLMEIERINSEATIVFLSEVRLDMPVVLEKLRHLFVEYNYCPPVAIILMGSFCSADDKIYNVKQLFRSLGEQANGCDRLKKETDLILVPSCEDPVSPSILPKPPLLDSLILDLKQKWPRTKAATNPCRLQYCTQQIVVCRADLVTKFCRNTIHFPDSDCLESHFARTLICQGTLVPMHPIVLPVYWDYDTALSLYPLPDLIVIGDPYQPFTITQHGCTIINTGSFVKSKFNFKVYVPATKTVEDSEITTGT